MTTQHDALHAIGILVDWHELPDGVRGLVVLLVGWCAATLARLLISRLLSRHAFTRLCERSGIHEFLRKGGVQQLPSELVARAAYWIAMLWTLLVVVDVASARGWQPVLDRITRGLPSLVMAVSVLIFGYAIVAFLANVVRTLASNSASPYADLYRRLVRWLGLTVVLVLVAEQIGMTAGVVGTLLLILTAAVALGTALAFGLGCRDMARDAMSRLLRDIQERSRRPPDSDMEG